eukprot:TRINITY_DN20118_c0_g1_i2.p1 TRINITY_DN20118_c0_g1~~TRINITY_DN20118_c0_g1_i2.p1  ORF type:complete len:217 (-),score=58.35 TRINITY_DN20118_c0_g1_i2:33-626(-)
MCIRDSVSSYHCAVPESMKFLREKSYAKAVSGFNVAGATLTALWTILATQLFLCENKKEERRKNTSELLIGGFPEDKQKYEDILCLVIRLFATAPAEAAGLGERKGKIRKGFDADLVIFDPFCRGKTPFYGKYPQTALFRKERLIGKVVDVYLRGHRIVHDSKTIDKKFGEILRRSNQTPHNPVSYTHLTLPTIYSV